MKSVHFPLLQTAGYLFLFVLQFNKSYIASSYANSVKKCPAMCKKAHIFFSFCNPYNYVILHFINYIINHDINAYNSALIARLAFGSC